MSVDSGTDRLRSVLDGLAIARPVFHSEADFQHSFAWAIREREHHAVIRLERRVPMAGKRAHLDLYVRLAGTIFALELKYKTRQIDVAIQDEEFALPTQSAEDHGRYDYCRDIWRLEQLLRTGHADVGAAVFLSNEPLYWKDTRHPAPADTAFRVHEGRVLKGVRTWPENANPNNTKGREAEIALTGCYSARWCDYSVLAGARHGTFRYLWVEIGAGRSR